MDNVDVSFYNPVDGTIHIDANSLHETSDMFSYKYEVRLANSLREIYYKVVIEGEEVADTALLQDIIYIVESSFEQQQSVFHENPAVSYRTSTSHALAQSFWNKYQDVILDSERVAYSIKNQFGHAVDLASVILPYVLFRLGVTSDSISFYVGLGMVLSNIICDLLASQEEKRLEEYEKKKIVLMCKELRTLLRYSEKRATTKLDSVKMQKSLAEINKILDT